jgi:adenosylcobinamide kinase/adenosylcobinamide-phosphate guanylyltransferase
MKRDILLTGGARSGKSRKAEDLAKEIGGRILFVATAEAGDQDMAERIKRHQADRPQEWHTLEAPSNIGAKILQVGQGYDVIIVDCLTMLTCNIIGQAINEYGEDVAEQKVEELLAQEMHCLQEAAQTLRASFLIVTNEVGLGVVPDNRLGRLYRDILGRANQSMASVCSEVILLISGCSMYAKGAPPPCKKGR